MSASEMFLIEKRGLYYRPNAQGYTGLKYEAGRYTLDEAALHVGVNGPDGQTDGLGIWRESEAPEYSPRCAWDVKMKREAYKAGYDQARADIPAARIAELEAENARLREALSGHQIWESAEKVSDNEFVLWASDGQAAIRMKITHTHEKLDKAGLEFLTCDLLDLLNARAALDKGEG